MQSFQALIFLDMKENNKNKREVLLFFYYNYPYRMKRIEETNFNDSNHSPLEKYFP